MAFSVPAGHAVKSGPKGCSLARAIKEGMKKRVIRRWRDFLDARIAVAEGIIVMGAAFDEFADVPFQIGC